MKPIKILRLTTFLDYGGQEKQYISFSNYANRDRFTYIFASIGKGGYAEGILKNNGFEVKIFNNNPSFMNLRFTFLLYKWLKFIKPDLIHTAAGEANFHGIIAANLAGIKYIVSEEIGFPNHSLKAKLLFSFLYRFTYKVICVSRAVKDYLIEIGEINSDKGIVIYNPVSNLKGVSLNHQKSFTIVSVGRLEKVKNQFSLIRILDYFKDNSLKLILVGDGKDRFFLENHVSRLGLNEQVLITGFVPNPEVYLSKADLFVLPSISEGFGISVIEAMHLGIPCLCTNIGGIPEIISDGDNGWLFNPHNFFEFVEKFQSIRNMDRKSLVEIGNRGKMSVSDRFTERHYVYIIEKFYKNIIIDSVR